MPRGFSRTKHPELYDTAGDKPVVVKKHRRAKKRRRGRSLESVTMNKKEQAKWTAALVSVDRDTLMKLAIELLYIARGKEF